MRSIRSQSAWCARAQWTMTILMVSLIGAYAVLGWWPANRRLGALRAEIAARSQRIETNQARASSLPNLAIDVDRLRLKLERFNKQLPKTPGLEDFINDAAQFSNQYGIKRMMHQPGVTRRLELYGETPIVMSFEGEFNNVFTFVRQLEEMPRLTRVKTLNVRSKDGKLGLVDVNLVMNTYFSEQ
jgi:Tfp pilus assembly protein PilO